MEVNSVHVHLVAHSQEIPVDLLALGHHQSMEVAVQLTIDPFNRHNDTVSLVHTHTHTQNHRHADTSVAADNNKRKVS